MERIKKILFSHNIRPSHHRIMILKFLANTREHPTVEDIYNNLVVSVPTISKATIYNTLKLLLKKDLVSSFNLSGEESRYDYKSSVHAHFHCIQCQNVIDIHSKYPCFDINTIGPNRILEIQLVFKGLCESCQKHGNKHSDIDAE